MCVGEVLVFGCTYFQLVLQQVFLVGEFAIEAEEALLVF